MRFRPIHFISIYFDVANASKNEKQDIEWADVGKMS